MSIPSPWFSPWEPQPHFCHPVADQSINDRISVTVRYAVKSGPAFLDMMKQKHQGDPSFSWMFAGEAYHYFRWSLFCALHNLPVDQPPPGPHVGASSSAVMGGVQPMQQQQPAQMGGMQPMQQPAQMLPQPAQQSQQQYALPPEVESGFKQVLESLSGSKVWPRPPLLFLLSSRIFEPVTYYRTLSDRNR